MGSPTRARQRKSNLQVWGSGQKQKTLRWGLFFPVHLKITIRGLSLDHPTWNQSWRANSYLCNTKGTELVPNALTWNTRIPVLATARLILVPSRSLAGCNRMPYISSLRAISRSWKSDSAGVCPLTKQKFKRKARRFEFSVSMNSRLSIFSWEIKRHFITNNGAIRSDDTQPPIHYNPKLSNWNKSSIACVTQNPKSLSQTRPVFWNLREFPLRSYKSKTRSCWNKFLVTYNSPKLAKFNTLSRQLSPRLKCLPWNTTTKTKGAENALKIFYWSKQKTKMDMAQRFSIFTIFLYCP